MSKLPLLYVQGVNGSFAQRLMPEDQMRTINDSTNNHWVVIGAHDVLDQAEKGEYGYTIDADFDEIMKLPTDTPIYASVNSFESFNKEDHESCWFPVTKVTGSSIIWKFNFFCGVNVFLLPLDMDIQTRKLQVMRCTT